MQLILTQTWVLSDEHSASSYGKPVLVERDTGEAYGPRDILEPYPSWGVIPGRAAVQRMNKRKPFTEDEQAFIDRFYV